MRKLTSTILFLSELFYLVTTVNVHLKNTDAALIIESLQ